MQTDNLGAAFSLQFFVNTPRKKKRFVGYSAYKLIYRKVTRTEALEGPSQRWRENELANTERLRNMLGSIHKKNLISVENLWG